MPFTRCPNPNPNVPSGPNVRRCPNPNPDPNPNPNTNPGQVNAQLEELDGRLEDLMGEPAPLAIPSLTLSLTLIPTLSLTLTLTLPLSLGGGPYTDMVELLALRGVSMRRATLGVGVGVGVGIGVGIGVGVGVRVGLGLEGRPEL